MGWESSDVFRFHLGPLSRSNNDSLTLVSCLFGGYKFASVLRYVGLVFKCSLTSRLWGVIELFSNINFSLYNFIPGFVCIL